MKAKSEEQFLSNLGKRLAAVRKARGMTQQKLAEEAELDRVAVAYIETGKRKPKVTSMYRMAVALHIDIDELFKGL